MDDPQNAMGGTPTPPSVPAGMEKFPAVPDLMLPPPPHQPTPSRWTREAMTMFCRGVARGLFPAVAGGATGIALTSTTDAATIAAHGAIGFAAGLGVKGLERFHLWVTKDENELPTLSSEAVKKIALIILVVMLALKLSTALL